jgi:cleavage and polyadenylation specificity factor subunit 4
MTPNYKKTVCEFWVKRQCTRGDDCGFLHVWDPSRLPLCRNYKIYNACNMQGCNFKHGLQEPRTCNMYSLGFCIYGKTCCFKHIKNTSPPPTPSRFEAAKPMVMRNEELVKFQAINLKSFGSKDQFKFATSVHSKFEIQKRIKKPKLMNHHKIV